MSDKKKREEYYSCIDVVKILDMLAEHNEFEKKKPYPRFSEEEVEFLIELIFRKPNNLVYIYLADFINTNYFNGKFFMNGSHMKKMQFFYNFFRYRGNATKAVIASGYSKKCAKQQAYRIMRELRGI